MSGADWRALCGVDRRRLSEARLQAHHAVQWLACAARAFVPPQPDDNHTNLGWDGALEGFTTHPLKDDLRLGLRLTDLSIALLGGNRKASMHPLCLSGRPDAQARHWLTEQLGAHGLDARALDQPSPYEIPRHPISTGAAYDTTDLVDALRELAAWFANADSALGDIRGHLSERGLAPSPARCWPHHFDLATLISFPARTGETAFIGVGLSPGDMYYDEPYFYVTIYPAPDTAKLPPLSLGHWHTEEFVGACAPAHKILMTQDHEMASNDFLQNAVEAAVRVLGRA
jgi:hypothetical protein